jgi:GGDEF domain-containing protein
MRISEELFYLGAHDALIGLYHRSFLEEEMRWL